MLSEKRIYLNNKSKFVFFLYKYLSTIIIGEKKKIKNSTLVKVQTHIILQYYIIYNIIHEIMIKINHRVVVIADKMPTGDIYII